MKNNILKSLFISVILLAGTSNVWAWDIYGNLYFNNSSKKWTNVSLIVGNDSWHQGYKFSKLNNTQLYYSWVNYSGYNDLYFVNANYTSNGNSKPYDKAKNYTNWQPGKFDYKESKQWYFDAITQDKTLILPKYTATADIKVSKDGGNTYDVTHDITLGVLTLTGTYMNGDAATGQSTATTDGTHKYNYENIPVTGEFTLTNTSVTNEAYEFVGFGTEDQPTINSNSHTWNVTASTTYYAFYKAKSYTITLDPQNGESKSTVTATYGSAMPTIAKPQKTGYTFDGYWTGVGGTGTQYYNADGKSAKNWDKTSATTLYAKWTPIEYQITYHLNGGENHASNPANYTIETPTITLQAPTKNEATFEGWYSHANFAGEKITTIAQGTTGDIELYAKWAETTYAVNIYSNNINYGITTPSGARWVGATPLELIATPHTGYHFTEWKATGGATIANPNNATTTITATAAGTATAHFKETLHNITVQASNNEHGKVTQSAEKAGVSTAITITAEPMEGYEFTGWSKDGDITIASINSATTTLTATGAGTVTANFALKGSTPIYFKANHAWTAANAWFAVYYWETGKDPGWSVLNPICGNDYYKAEVPAGYTGFKFVRFRPSTANGYVPDNGGLNWTNPWNQSGDLVVPTDGKTMFDTKKVYLKPNDKWKTDNMRFAAYFYVSSNDSKNKWMNMELTSIDGVYSCDIPTEYEGADDYNHVIFCRMDPSNNNNNWGNCKNQSDHFQLFSTESGTFDKNCFTLWNDQWGSKDNPATGQWSLINDEATYDVTLYSCSFGEYGFIHNTVEYTSPESGSITYQIPVNATVKVFSKPYSKEYRGDVMVNQAGTPWEITPDKPVLNITCHTILDDNYKTIGEHEVYLAVPHVSGDKTWWENHDLHTNYLYAFHDRTGDGNGYSVKMDEVGTATINSQVHTYYRCVIPAEVNTIRFEKHLTSNNSNVLQTIDLRYDIPLNNVNCYRLDRSDGSKKAGIWEQAPGFGSDFRLVHHRAEGVSYPSDIIRYGTISQVVSLHISTKDANAEYPKLELQQRNANGEWIAVPEQSKLVKDINRIMSDKQDNGCGVWNFTVTTDGANHASVNFNTPQRYTGNYYIRTNNAEGEWRNYTLSTNHMTFSSYAKNHSGYTHYFCRYIDIKNGSSVPGHSKNVKFIIANDYAAALSNELADDSHTNTEGDLPESANVRWTWNEMTNDVSRAYILGSSAKIDHIVATATDHSGVRLKDQENWIYEIDIENVKQSQTLNVHATYPSKTINNIAPVTQTFADNLEMIKADANNPNEYKVRVMYDFKINKTLIMLCPDQINGADIGVDVFIDRPDQGEASQVQSGATVTSTNDDGYTIYATLTLSKDSLLDTSRTEWERLYYWISFPFDVRISEIFGFGEYGKHYIIQYYDGAERAKNGCWADSPTYWRNITDTTYSKFVESEAQGNEDANGNPNNGILVANKGYVLALARNIANSNIFDHGNDYVRLYFPSREKIHSIDATMQNTTIYLQPHTCTIERDDRYIYDSNWHIIGVPSYANKEQTLTQENLLYYYTYNNKENTYSVTSAQGAQIKQIKFKSMHAYMVQYAGYINWQSWTLTPESKSVVARQQSAEAVEKYALRLELQRDGQYADQAFIQLKAEGATADFDLNQDLTKIINAGANIYTLAGEKRVQVAGNVLPIAKTTIPVGIQVAQAGTYTIALPDGTSGISATLVDNLTGTHTNLLLDNYTVTLNTGTTEGRFYIVLDPERTATAVENIDNEAQSDKAQKFLIDGQLIIRTKQGVYDATGGKVK